MTITCGIDWAEAHHDVALVDESGRVIARARIGADVAGFTELVELIADHGGSPAETPIAIETDKNLLVVALAGAGFIVYPINPRAVARYRERHLQAGGKSDPGDAKVLANILRTDRHPPTATDQQRASAGGQGTGSAVSGSDLGDAPNDQQVALGAVGVLSPSRAGVSEAKAHAATTVLAAAPTPAAGLKLTRRRVEALLHKCGRRNDPKLVDQILHGLKTPALRQPAQVEAALGLTVQALLAIIEAMRDAVEALEAELAREFAAHPLSAVLQSAPGLGPVLAARLLAEIGDDPDRFASVHGVRAFAGTAPVTRASGRTRYVKARKVRNKRLGNACHWWAFAALTWSPGARAHYDRRRAAGDHHNAALRNLANKLIGRMWWCVSNNEMWDEGTAWPNPAIGPQTTAA